jgi:hypothetical protein
VGLLEQLGEPGFVEGRLGTGEHRHLERVGIHRDHLVADGRHRRGMHGAEIATTDHRDTHQYRLLAL